MNSLAETVIDPCVDHTRVQQESGSGPVVHPPVQSTLLVLRGPETEAFTDRVKQRLGVDLPVEASVTPAHKGITLFRRGAGDWVIIAPSADRSLLVKELTAALADRPGAVVDLSERCSLIQLTGNGAWKRLTAACHPSFDSDQLMNAGSVKTICAGIGVDILSYAEDQFMILAQTAYASHVSVQLQ
jgi:heterotetrameric sarcosine oxidase gamma subunit